jgi:hypothetical protein
MKTPNEFEDPYFRNTYHDSKIPIPIPNKIPTIDPMKDANMRFYPPDEDA